MDAVNGNCKIRMYKCYESSPVYGAVKRKQKMMNLMMMCSPQGFTGSHGRI